MRRVWLLGAFTVVLTALMVVGVGVAVPGDTFRASLSASGLQANNDSSQIALSADGRFAAFRSVATNLVPNDSNNAADVFVKDMQTGAITRVSVASDGTQADNQSWEPSLSPDGRWVTFGSFATNLVGAGADTNGSWDIFLHDRQVGTTTRVTSGIGNGGQANANSFWSVISADTNYIAYWSWASNIVPGDTNGAPDVFLYHRLTGTTERVSISNDEQQGLADPAGGPDNEGAFGASREPSISADGNLVAFESDADNLVPGDTNGIRDIFVRDRSAGTTRRVSVATGGTQATGGPTNAAAGGSRNARISADGSVVAYVSQATNLVPGDTNGDPDIFATALTPTLTTTRVSVSSSGSQSSGRSLAPTISADGKLVAYQSSAQSLVGDDTNGALDVFVHDRSTAKTTRQSLSHTGSQVMAASFAPYLAAGGFFVGFQSEATDLVSGDTNNRMDVFVHELGVKDTKPPVVTGTPDRPANGAGWYNADVVITWATTDPTPSSGLKTTPAPTTASNEASNYEYESAEAEDFSGNKATGKLKLSIDKTLPTVTATRNQPNAFGWNDEAVVVGFHCSDTLSGLESCAAPQTISAEGAGQSVSGTGRDRAGNEKTLTVGDINVDKTAPSLAFVGNTTYGLNATVAIDCVASDTVSGLDEETAVTPETTNCVDVVGPAYLFGPGSHTLSAYAVDNAGHDKVATFSFTITFQPQDLIDLICTGMLSKKERKLCKKLTRELERAQAYHIAGDIKRRNEWLRKFMMTGAKEVGRLITPAQMATLVRVVESVVASP